MPEVDIVVPILNEAPTVDDLISRLTAACPGAHLIFVDNGSTDGTLERLAARDIHTIRHSHNEGYGKSLRDGIAAATSPMILTIDADLEYPPESVPALLEALTNTPVVYGSRFLHEKPPMSFTRSLGNRTLTTAFNALYRQHITDLYTGIKAFRREVFASTTFHETGFVFVVEFAAHAARHCQIAEVPVPYRPRDRGQSKMSHASEGLRALAALLRYR